MTRRAIPELWGVTEIADSLGVSKSTVHDWVEKDGFPGPVVRLAMGPVYDAPQIRAWRRRQIEQRRAARAF